MFRLMRWRNKVQVNEMGNWAMQVKNAERLWWLEVRRRAGWLALMIMTQNGAQTIRDLQ